MNFSRYMREWLYGPGGYYRRYGSIGKEGDFYTSVSVSGFFGASIANHFMKVIKKRDINTQIWLIEIGAHRGYLLSDMIEWIYSCEPELMSRVRFATVERQPDLKKVQSDYFAERFGKDVKIEQFDSLDEIDAEYAFFVSNEIFDAFECELYMDGKMAIVNDGRIEWTEAEEFMADFARRHRLAKGEIALGYEEFASRVIDSAERFDFVTFDYGEKYVRNDFSVRIYMKHRTYPLFDEAVILKDVFKKSDITYDVNFSHVIEAFLGAGALLEDYETQARALVRFGIIDILEKYMAVSSREQYIRQSDRVKTLLSPTVMGDRFKMLHISG